VLEDDAQVGCNAVVGAVARADASGAGSILRRGATVGANATVLEGVEIGERAAVQPGSVVTDSVPRNAVVAGNPATIVGYVDTRVTAVDAPGAAPAVGSAREPGVRPTNVRGVTLHSFPVVTDLVRGSLTVGEVGPQLPFEPLRYFMVYDVPSSEVRGEHAHWACHQFLLCANGSLSVIVDDGVTREEFVLADRHTGIYLPPLTWGVQYRYSADAVLLAYASHTYDAADYIRDYDEFLAAIAQRDDAG